jgi:hypothetical protein
MVLNLFKHEVVALRMMLWKTLIRVNLLLVLYLSQAYLNTIPLLNQVERFSKWNSSSHVNVK